MYQPPDDLTGTAAIVSGASRGIGRIYALALAKAGAKVLATARTAEGDPGKPGSLAELAATARAEGLDITVRQIDLANEADIQATVSQCVEMYGSVDAVINNATFTISKIELMDVSREEWEASFRINILAPYTFMREAAPHMKARGGGSIVNITSLAGRPSVPGSGAHGFPSYAVTKAALERLSSYAGADLVNTGIAVNAISPGNPFFYMKGGNQPDIDFWGSPIVHLAAQRSPDGITGQILHTYEFGEKWGPDFETLPPRNERILEMLRISDKPFGYYAAR